MTQINYRANLSAAVFPMTVAKAGKSVIIPGPDQNFDRRIDAPGDTQRGSVGIPQVIYAENVFPTPEGFQSIGLRRFADITIPVSQTITELLGVRIATTEITETVSTGGAVAYTDSGNQLGVWDKSALEFYADAESSVEQISSDGNPQPSYRFLAKSGTTPISDPWLYKTFDIGDPDNSGFEFDFQYDTVFPEKSFVASIFNTVGGSGLKVIVDNNTGVEALRIISSTDKGGSSGVAVLGETAITSLALDTTYRLEVALVRTTGQTRDITAVIKNAGGVVLFTATGTYTVALDTYCGVLLKQVAGPTNNFLWIDNIEVVGDGVPVVSTVTEYTGIITAYIAFFSNNTANWSYDLSSWDNHPVTEGVGFVSPTDPSEISVATVRGVTYICIRVAGATKIYVATVDIGTDTITFTDISATIEAALPNPFDIDSILGIVGSYNYLILHTPSTILWSSTTTPTDFAPSLVSGAGNEIPGNLKGDMIFCKEHISGFFIYTDRNVVFAQYTGNARYPWKFREIGASGGFSKSFQVSGDTNSAVQYGINNSKFIQVLSPESAEIVGPEITSFFERVKNWDIYDTLTDTFSISPSSRELITDSRLKIWFILDRYLVVPYGNETASNVQYGYAIIYDLVLRRYGRLKIVMDFVLSDEKSAYFINRQTGEIDKLYFDINEQDLAPGEGFAYSHSGILILGKFQLARGSFLSLQELTVETIQDTDLIAEVDKQFDIVVLPTLDGKTFNTPVTPTDVTAATSLNCKEYKTYVHCNNFAIAAKGAFDLNTIELVVQPEGDE